MSLVPTTRHHHHGIQERESIIQWFWLICFNRIRQDGSVARKPSLTVLVPIQFQNEGKEKTRLNLLITFAKEVNDNNVFFFYLDEYVNFWIYYI